MIRRFDFRRMALPVLTVLMMPAVTGAVNVVEVFDSLKPLVPVFSYHVNGAFNEIRTAVQFRQIGDEVRASSSIAAGLEHVTAGRDTRSRIENIGLKLDPGSPEVKYYSNNIVPSMDELCDLLDSYERILISLISPRKIPGLKFRSDGIVTSGVMFTSRSGGSKSSLHNLAPNLQLRIVEEVDGRKTYFLRNKSSGNEVQIRPRFYRKHLNDEFDAGLTPHGELIQDGDIVSDLKRFYRNSVNADLAEFENYLDRVSTREARFLIASFYASPYISDVGMQEKFGEFRGAALQVENERRIQWLDEINRKAASAFVDTSGHPVSFEGYDIVTVHETVINEYLQELRETPAPEESLDYIGYQYLIKDLIEDTPTSWTFIPIDAQLSPFSINPSANIYLRDSALYIDANPFNLQGFSHVEASGFNFSGNLDF